MNSSQYVPLSYSPLRQNVSVPRLTSDLRARQRTSPGPGSPTSLVTTSTCRGRGKIMSWLRGTSEFYRLARPHAFVRRKADTERLHGVVHVAREVDVLGDRTVEIVLLAGAERVVPGLALHREQLVRLRELAVRPDRRMVDLDEIGTAMRLVVVRSGIGIHHDRHRAIGRHDVFDEERGLRNHRPPGRFVPGDRTVCEQHLE